MSVQETHSKHQAARAAAAYGRSAWHCDRALQAVHVTDSQSMRRDSVCDVAPRYEDVGDPDIVQCDQCMKQDSHAVSTVVKSGSWRCSASALPACVLSYILDPWQTPGSVPILTLRALQSMLVTAEDCSTLSIDHSPLGGRWCCTKGCTKYAYTTVGTVFAGSPGSFRQAWCVHDPRCN